ncbi:MAG: DUF1064 domain-containing protein [Prevotella sp.]|nr:DUF1064 domain-containing protein [Prevotella sp.]
MSVNYDEQWIRDYCARTGKQLPAELRQSDRSKGAAPQAARRAKYGNQRVEVDGEFFDSKHEAAAYELLKVKLRAGEFVGLARQVVFMLPGGVKYIADFVIHKRDRTFDVLDAKSDATRKDKTYRLKKRLMKECLGIEIQEV